jgi:hypothetical protein
MRDALVLASGVIGVLLLVLGLPALATVAVLRRRRLSHRQLAGATPFPAKGRIEFGDAPGLRGRYPRRWQRAAWIHDVVVFERGWCTPRLVPYAVESTGTLEGSDEGLDQMSLRLYLDSGGVIRLTANARDKTRLVGPFLMAELEASPNKRMMRGHR